MYALGTHFMHPMNYKKSMTSLVLIDQLSVTELLHVMTSNEQTSSVVDCGFEPSLGIRKCARVEQHVCPQSVVQ